MTPELKIAIEEIDALIDALYDHTGASVMTRLAAARKVADMRGKILTRVSAGIKPFEQTETPR